MRSRGSDFRAQFGSILQTNCRFALVLGESLAFRSLIIALFLCNDARAFIGALLGFVFVCENIGVNAR